MHINYILAFHLKIDDSEKFCWCFKVVKCHARIPFTIYYTKYSIMHRSLVEEITSAFTYMVISSVLVLWEMTVPSVFATRQGCVNKSRQQNVSGSNVSQFYANTVKNLYATCTSLLPSHDNLGSYGLKWQCHKIEQFDPWVIMDTGEHPLIPIRLWEKKHQAVELISWEVRVCLLQLLLITYPIMISFHTFLLG